MSISELIAQKYKKNIKVNKLKTPDEAAKVLIKDTKEFDVNSKEYTEGSSNE
jgi:inorganic pyrophosphatase/exopolyphosphatase